MPHHRAVRLLILLLTLLAIAPPAWAGIGRWTPFGPGGGHLRLLAVDTAGVLFGAAGEDLYRSADGGRSWQRSTRGLDGVGVVSIAVDTSHPGTLYAGALPNAVYRSTDGGASWTLLFTETSLILLQQIAVVPFPGGLPRLLIQDEQRILLSVDGGATFEPVVSTEPGLQGLLQDPANPQVLYVGSIDPEVPVVRSTDGGVTWENLPETGPAVPLAVAPTAPVHTVYFAIRGFVFKSSDLGETFERAGLTQDGVSFLAVDPADPSRLYATPEGGFLGIFLSTDGGETWSAQGRGPKDQGVANLLADPATGSIYALTPSRVYRSTDHGQSWTAGSLRGLLAADTQALVAAPSDPSVLYLDLRGSGFGKDTLLRSTDGGAHWTELVNAQTSFWNNLNALVVERKNPFWLWAATDLGIYESTDGGEHWTPRGGPKDARALKMTSGGTLLAGGCGVQRSRDGGRTWQDLLACVIPQGDPEDPDDDLIRGVIDLFVDPVHPDTVFADTNENGFRTSRPALYVSQNGGTSWRLAAKRHVRFAASPHKPSTLYMLVPKGLLRSTDGGRTWIPAGSVGLDQGLRNLAVDAGSAQILLAAAGERGVLRSTNGGRTWAPFNTGLAAFGRTCIAAIQTHPTEPGRAWASACKGGLLEIRPAAP